MEQIKNNKWFWIVVAFTVFNLGVFLISKIIIDRTTDRVIQRLQKDYSPSPYGPGFDPDKVSPDAFNSVKKYYEQRKVLNSKTFDEKLRQVSGSIEASAVQSDHWRENWEEERGVSR